MAPCVFDGPAVGLSKQGFELGEDLFDRVEVRAVGREEEELGACGSNSGANGPAFVASQVVDDDDVAWPERRDQDLLDIGEEGLAVDRPVEDAGCLDAIATKCCQEGQRAPSTLRYLGHQLVSTRRPAAHPGHVGLCPSLVDEDQSVRIEPVLISPPAFTPTRDLRTILLGCEQCFF